MIIVEVIFGVALVMSILVGLLCLAQILVTIMNWIEPQ